MSPTVAVVGALNIDMVVTADRLPGPGETVVGRDVARHGGGKGANAAVAAARVGASVRFVGAVGADDLGRDALSQLTGEGVGVDDVQIVTDAPTGVALIVVDGAGENQIAVGAGANDHLDAAHVRAALRRIPDLDVVLVSTEVPAAAVVAAVGTAAGLGLRCLLDPAPVVPSVVGLLELGPLLTPNTGELADLLRAAGASPDAPPPSPVDGAASLHTATGSPVVVTLGGDGMLLVDSGGAGRLRAHPTTVRDTTGAGDTANGVLAARLAAGDDLGDAVHAANVAAALSVAVTGARAGMPTAEALDAALEAAGG